MGLIVDPAVRALLTAAPATAAQFTAACVERCAQLFTGTSGSLPGREEDLTRCLEVLDKLWDPTLPSAAFAAEVGFIEALPEMRPEEPPELALDIAAAFAVLTMRHAVKFRASGELDFALLCAHACLTLAGLHDQNVPDSCWSDEERRFQTEDAAEPGEPTAARLRYQAIGRERLIRVRQRSR